jgi:hypothetical protein
MNNLANFEIVGQRGFFRPAGKVSFEQAADLVAEAMKVARAAGLASLLINTQGFTGFASPSILGRHQLALKWAENAGPALHVAFVARPEMIDPEKIGVIMVQNRGVSGDVFTSEAAAIAWLDSRQPGRI